MIGRVVDKYTILEKVGTGGMGEVYLAQHARINRRVAIKFLLPQLSRDAEVVNRFFNEARATSAIRHPGIVEIFDCDVLEDRAYMVMEYLEGENLASAVQRAKGFATEPRTVAAVAGRIADALAAAHAKLIFHRDLKPENVFLALNQGDGAAFGVKILDFGVAKLAGEDFGRPSHTRTGVLLGTPEYMAPEQCRGAREIDHRADIYALGCIIFEMLTGRQVFESQAPGELMTAHIHEPAPTISSLVPSVPGEIETLVASMLAKEPGARPQSMEAVCSVFEDFLSVSAADFIRTIPLTSRMMPLSRVRRLMAPTPPKAAVKRAPAKLAPPPVAPIVAGGTKMLPRPVPAAAALAGAVVPSRRSRRPVVIVGALAVVLAVVILLVGAQVTRHPHETAIESPELTPRVPTPATPATPATPRRRHRHQRLFRSRPKAETTTRKRAAPSERRSRERQPRSSRPKRRSLSSGTETRSAGIPRNPEGSPEVHMHVVE